MKRSQLIATILALATVGTVAHADICSTRLQPVGELVTTRAVVAERPLYRARIIERPLPVAERITTRRITTLRRVNHLEPVGEVITTRRSYLDPVGERYMDRTADGFARVVTAPFRIATAPFRAFASDPAPEIVGERITTVTRVNTPRRVYKKKLIRRSTTTTTLAPVGERLILCP